MSTIRVALSFTRAASLFSPTASIGASDFTSLFPAALRKLCACWEELLWAAEVTLPWRLTRLLEILQCAVRLAVTDAPELICPAASGRRRPARGARDTSQGTAASCGEPLTTWHIDIEDGCLAPACAAARRARRSASCRLWRAPRTPAKEFGLAKHAASIQELPLLVWVGDVPLITGPGRDPRAREFCFHGHGVKVISSTGPGQAPCIGNSSTVDWGEPSGQHVECGSGRR